MVSKLTVANILDGALVVDVNVETIGLVVHGAHGVGLEDTVLLGEVLFGEGLRGGEYRDEERKAYEEARTTSSWSSPIFLPISLFVHSSILSPPLLWSPGTTRGMLSADLVAKVRLRRVLCGRVVVGGVDGLVERRWARGETRILIHRIPVDCSLARDPKESWLLFVCGGRRRGWKVGGEDVTSARGSAAVMVEEGGVGLTSPYRHGERRGEGHLPGPPM